MLILVLSHTKLFIFKLYKIYVIPVPVYILEIKNILEVQKIIVLFISLNNKQIHFYYCTEHKNGTYKYNMYNIKIMSSK